MDNDESEIRPLSHRHTASTRPPDHLMTLSDPEHPSVAILMAVCNGRLWLEEQIDSILAQTGVRTRLFISVDPSTDGSGDYCRQRAADDDRISVLTGEGPGTATGNFFRLVNDAEVAGFDYIALADQDDHWCDDKLQRAIERLRDSDAQGYSSNVTAVLPDGRRKLIRKDYPQRRWDFLFESPGPGCSFVLTRPLYDDLRANLTGLRNKARALRFHDVYIYAFARANGYRWIIDRESRMLYRQHTGNTLGANLGLKAMRFRLGYILSGQGLGESLRVADAVGAGTSDFVNRWRRLDRSAVRFLLFSAPECRRRPLDRLYFALIMTFMWLRFSFRRPRTGNINPKD